MESNAALLQLYSGVLYYAFLIVFLVTYIFVFRRGKDVAFKRKWWPRFIILFGVLTAAKLAFFLLRPMPTAYGDDQKTSMTVMVLIISGLVFFRLKNTRFCDKCSALVRGRVHKSRAACPKCGAQLASE